MSKIKELEELLKTDIMVELQQSIEELEKILKKKSNNKDAKQELKNMKDLEEDFNAVVEDIKNGDMSQEEAKEILEELENMRIDEQSV